MEPVRRSVLNKRRELILANQREIARLVGRDGMYPLNAPGMPLPGPNFSRQADAELGDTDTQIKKTKDGVSFVPGDVLNELYRRALREPGFTLLIA
jgi:hypothetical protein